MRSTKQRLINESSKVSGYKVSIQEIIGNSPLESKIKTRITYKSIGMHAILKGKSGVSKICIQRSTRENRNKFIYNIHRSEDFIITEFPPKLIFSYNLISIKRQST